ncbi:MAG TPA: hypothetical protein VGD02_14100 [Gemmatimonadaceae bacterium]
MSCAGRETQLPPAAAASGGGLQHVADTAAPSAPAKVPELEAVSLDTLPAGYTLTDTTSWATIEEDGQRAILRRGQVAIDTVDLLFGVAVVGQDSLVFLPVRTDSLPLPTASVPSYESFPTQHIFWTPALRRELRNILPFFSAFSSSPTTPRDGVIHYWGIAPHAPTNRIYAMRYDFRTGRLDSLFLDREDPVATDYRYHFGIPEIRPTEVSFDGVVVDRTTWRVIRHDPPRR